MHLLRVAGIEQYQRVQVAVAGMEHIGHRQAIVLGEAVDFIEHFRHFTARNGAVHTVVIGCDATDGGERRFAPLPQQRAVSLVIRHSEGGRAQLLKHCHHGVDMLCDLLARAVHLAQQDGSGIPRIPRMGEILRCLHREPVHHLQPGGDDAGGDDRAHCIASRIDAVKSRHHHAGDLRRG